jgi:hypothetical protein
MNHHYFSDPRTLFKNIKAENICSPVKISKMQSMRVREVSTRLSPNLMKMHRDVDTDRGKVAPMTREEVPTQRIPDHTLKDKSLANYHLTIPQNFPNLCTKMFQLSQVIPCKYPLMSCIQSTHIGRTATRGNTRFVPIGIRPMLFSVLPVIGKALGQFSMKEKYYPQRDCRKI